MEDTMNYLFHPDNIILILQSSFTYLCSRLESTKQDIHPSYDMDFIHHIAWTSFIILHGPSIILILFPRFIQYINNHTYQQMANQSAKKNQQAIKGKKQFIYYVLYPLFAIFVIINMFYLLNESITLWHLIFCALIAAISHFCIKQTVKCWELQLPDQASEYYIDILAMNFLVAILDPFFHQVWHIYWLVPIFLVCKLGKYGWQYITPQYEQGDEQQGKKQKKQKKEKVKYMKVK